MTYKKYRDCKIYEFTTKNCLSCYQTIKGTDFRVERKPGLDRKPFDMNQPGSIDMKLTKKLMRSFKQNPGLSDADRGKKERGILKHPT